MFALSKGKLIMPAFSVGRTQEILYALNQLELETGRSGLFCRGPLSIEATEIVKNILGILIKEFNRYCN
jgi:metallo-beta-lactamase family protein